MAENGRARLYVCITCTGEDEERPAEPEGRRLYDALAGNPAYPDVEVTPVRCLANCERGCSAAISESGKWGYLLGGLDEAAAADVLTYSRAYAESARGVVMPSRRPESLRHAIVARFPVPGPDGATDVFGGSP